MDFNLEEKLKEIISFAKENKCLISPIHLEAVLFKTKGKCLCKINTPCPCKDAPKELQEKNKCYCGLFIKK